MKEHYLGIKKRLQEQVQELELVDWYLEQEKIPGELRSSPNAYIQILPISWESESNDVESGHMQFKIHLMSQTAYGDENDMIDKQQINHLNIERNIYKALKGFSFSIGYISDAEGAIIMNSIQRIKQTIHSKQSRIIHTVQTFRSRAYDHSAVPECQEVIAQLNLTAELVDTLVKTVNVRTEDNPE